jgi:hypothetical protein
MVALISKDRVLEHEITFVSLHESSENDFENDSDCEHSVCKRLF